MDIAVILPIRDDWTSAAELLQQLAREASGHGCSFHVLLVDDGSSEPCDVGKFRFASETIGAVTLLRLKRNLGHQRAIAIGLVYTLTEISSDAVVVMDADGEDTAAGVVELIQEFSRAGGSTAVFAERRRRTESLQFRIFYRLYRSLHWLLTGIQVRVGNFSILPRRYLSTIVVLPELWNHYAAAVFKSRLPFAKVPIARGHRIAGTSKMNFVSLVTHGLSAISVFGDLVGARLLLATLTGSVLAGGGILAVIAIKLFTQLAIPGWATYAIGSLVIIMMQLLTMAASMTFFILFNRSNLGFIPSRDAAIFIEDAVVVPQGLPAAAQPSLLAAQ